MMILRRIWFCLTVPKHFLEKLFCASEIFWHAKVLCLKARGGGGSVPTFRRNCFVLQYRNIS